MTHRQDMTDGQLVEQFVAGDEAAFDQLVQRYYRQVYGFLARFVGHLQTAEDLTQETFTKVHLSADTFDTSRAFKPWLFAIAANQARDALRAAGRAVRTVDLEARQDDKGQSLVDILPARSEPPEERLVQQETGERVKAAVELLPEPLREVLILAYYHHLQYKEIAEIVGIPLGTVKSRLHKAVMMFGTIWKSSGHERE